MAFPFVTIIMTLAVPFAVTTGGARPRRHPDRIAISIVYWVILNVFSALGEGGVTTPRSRRGPNILFGAAALTWA